MKRRELLSAAVLVAAAARAEDAGIAAPSKWPGRLISVRSGSGSVDSPSHSTTLGLGRITHSPSAAWM